MNFSIGTLARLGGVHVETVRYYERIGLLDRPPRAGTAIRRYAPEAVQRLRFIKRAQWLGFSLEEVAKLLSLAEAQECCETRALGNGKLRVVERKLEELTKIRQTLETLVAECARHRGGGCPLIDVLRGNAQLPMENVESQWRSDTTS